VRAMTPAPRPARAYARTRLPPRPLVAPTRRVVAEPCTSHKKGYIVALHEDATARFHTLGNDGNRRRRGHRAGARGAGLPGVSPHERDGGRGERSRHGHPPRAVGGSEAANGGHAVHYRRSDGG